MSSEFEITILASGSKGNAAVIRAGEQAFLVDVGISCRQLTERLHQAGMKPEDLTGVLLTHEHNDHVKGLPVFCRKYRLPVFANESTWQYIPKKSEMERSCCRLLPKKLSSGSLEIIPFAVPHDAASTVGYVFKSGGSKCTYLTDVGFVTDEVRQNIADADVVVLEANHDVKMLEAGPYPYYLKRRILGDYGHLSNENAGRLLSSILHDNLKHIFLGHLSKENNYEELAYETVRLEITEGDTPYKANDFPITVAKRDAVSQIVTV